MVIYGMNEKAKTKSSNKIFFNNLSSRIRNYRQLTHITNLKSLDNENIEKLLDLANKAHAIAPTFASKKFSQYATLTILGFFMKCQTESIVPCSIWTFFVIYTSLGAGYYFSANLDNQYTKHCMNVSEQNLNELQKAKTPHCVSKAILIKKDTPKCLL